MRYEIQPLTDEEAKTLGGKLAEYVRSVAPPRPDAKEETVVLKIEDDAGRIIGGCIVVLCTWNWDRMLITTLWVDERFRKQGLASMLLREAERIGRERGCTVSCLGTLDFMARGLYEKHGYTVFTTKADCPKGHTGWSLSKRIDLGTPDYVPTNNSGAERYEIRRGAEEDAEAISAGIAGYSRSFVPDEHEEIPIQKKLVDGDGRLIAGIVAEVRCWDQFDVDVLWVEEPFRNQGLGSRLLGEAEREAIGKGATILYASAGDWNVGFFRKKGYTVIGELADIPKGHNCFELEKRI